MWTLQRCPSSRWCGRVFFWQFSYCFHHFSPREFAQALSCAGKRHCFHSGRSEKQCWMNYKKHDSQGFPKMGVSNMKIFVTHQLVSRKVPGMPKIGCAGERCFLNRRPLWGVVEAGGSWCFRRHRANWSPKFLFLNVDLGVEPTGLLGCSIWLDFLLEGQKLDLRAEVQRCADPWGCQKVVKVVILFGLEEHTHTIFVLKPILKQPFLVPDVWANYVWLILMFSDLRSRPCNK